MLRRKKLFLFLGAMSLTAAFLVTSAWAAPDPTVNKNAILVDLDCGGYHVVASGIFQSHSPTFLVVSSELPGVEPGSTAPTFGYDAWDNPARAGDPVASFRQPGFYGTYQRTAADGVRLRPPEHSRHVVHGLLHVHASRRVTPGAPTLTDAGTLQRVPALGLRYAPLAPPDSDPQEKRRAGLPALLFAGFEPQET